MFFFFPFTAMLRSINFALKDKGITFLELNCRRYHSKHYEITLNNEITVSSIHFLLPPQAVYYCSTYRGSRCLIVVRKGYKKKSTIIENNTSAS